MSGLAYTLEQAEADLRNTYWLIRASRETNWRAVNKVRVIRGALERMGVTRQEIKDAMHCLKTNNCKRCNWNASDGLDAGLPCWAISRRRAQAKR